VFIVYASETVIGMATPCSWCIFMTTSGASLGMKMLLYPMYFAAPETLFFWKVNALVQGTYYGYLLNCN
jgi:hypothetical protein